MAAVAYLDTHVAVWLFAGDAEQLSTEARRTLDRCDLLISPVVVLELQLLCEIGRASNEGAEVADDLRRRLGIQICDLPFADVVRRSLDLRWTRDPFDRLIVAQAACRDSALVTKDRTLRRRYAAAVW